MGVGGSVLSVLTQFLSNRSQYVVVDGCRSKLVNVVSGVPQGSVFGPHLFFLYTMELFSVVETKLYGKADGSTLIAVVSTHSERVAVTQNPWIVILTGFVSGVPFRELNLIQVRLRE